jgi:hypothetical protein
MGLLPKPPKYPVDYTQISQSFRDATQSPEIVLPTSQEITTDTLFSTPQEFTTGGPAVFLTETTNTSTEVDIVTVTQKAILRLMTIAAIQYSGTWIGPMSIRWRIRRGTTDILNIQRYMNAGTAPFSYILGECFSLNNFIVLPGDVLYVKYDRNVSGAEFQCHAHLHGTLLP